MLQPLIYDRNWGKWFLNDVLKAIRLFGLVPAQARIWCALSGGRDSTVLLYILKYLQKFSTLDFQLAALHVKTADYDTSPLAAFCADLEVEFTELQLEEFPSPSAANPCYLCSRLKRGAISRFLQDTGDSIVAYGHHADDVAETFLMNIMQHQRLGSFSPRVSWDNNKMVLIRPLIFLSAAKITRIHARVGLPEFKLECPFTQQNLRREYREKLKAWQAMFPRRDFSRALALSLLHPDETNNWQDLLVPEHRHE